jgi:hypothetical protein
VDDDEKDAVGISDAIGREPFLCSEGRAATPRGLWLHAQATQRHAGRKGRLNFEPAELTNIQGKMKGEG